MARREYDSIGKLQLTGQGGADTTALLLGVGTNANPAVVTEADENFVDLRMKGTAATGTYRGIYAKLYMSGGAGGEALRAFANVGANAPADTVNGAHISLEFGSTTGNVTGMGSAVRATVMVPNRSLGGTVAPIISELWATGTSSTSSGGVSCFRVALDGDTTGAALLLTKGYLFDIATTTPASGGGDMISVGTSMSTVTGTIRIKLNGANAYIPYYSHEGHS